MPRHRGVRAQELLQRQLTASLTSVGQSMGVPGTLGPPHLTFQCPSPLPHPPPPHLAFQQEFWKDSPKVFA